MRTTARRLRIPASMLALVSTGCLALANCGNDDDPTIDSSAEAVPPPVPSDQMVVPGTLDMPVSADTSDIPAPPVGSADIALPPPAGSSDIVVPITIDVVVGSTSSPDRLDTVPIGSTVIISVTNPSSDDEFHLHGYELGDEVVMPAGQAETFTFVADLAGEFELESHETGDVLLTLSVV